MKPEAFSYHRAASVEDAVSVLASAGGMALALAGGQSLMPILNLRLAPLETLVDLGYLAELRQCIEQADSVRYGTLVTHAAFEDRRVPDASNGLMPHVAARIAYRAVRTRGTIGGSIALADPAADWLPTLIALGADITLTGPRGRRTIATSDFVVGAYTTALQNGELIEAIIVPRRSKSERWGYYKVAPKAGEYAKSLAIVLLDTTGGSARVSLGAVDRAPLQLPTTALAALNGADGDVLAGAVHAELAASGRNFSPIKLTLHTTAVVRAIMAARAK